MRGKKSNWMFPYSLAKAYYEFHGNLDIPSTFKTINGYEKFKEKEEVKENEKPFDLGQWLSRQRYGNIDNDYYNITDKQRELLNEIEMIWDVNEYRWNKMYELAKAHYNYHGNLDIPHSFKTINGYEKAQDSEKTFPLGQWIRNQREFYNRIKFSSLDKEKIEKLNEIEMIWDANEHKWNKMYELAKAYYKHHGHLNITKRFRTKNGYEKDADGFKLGNWIDTQKRKYREKIEGKLTDKQLRLLEELDISWFGKKDEEYQKELITSTNRYRKQIEIYNRFRTYINSISNDTNMPSKEEINQGFIDQLDEKDIFKNEQKVNSLERAIDETVKEYEYEKNPDRMEMFIYYLISHIDRIDQYEDAYLAFTEKNGAREYIKSRGKTALLEEMYYSLALNDENIDSIYDIYQEYANNYYNKKCNKEVNQELVKEEKEKRREK